MAWRRIEDTTATSSSVTLQIEGRPVRCRAEDTIAIAMLEAGASVFRETPVSGAPRAPLCLMGVCFECLVEVDGRPNVQACMTPVAEGMQVHTQHGARHPEGS
jgi:predicted molibdopterin-dependent oxidoreductase YjgC